MLRVTHADAIVGLATSPDLFFNAFTRWAGYEYWSPDVQGAGHGLFVRRGGSGSQFMLYDKPGPRHLVQFGEVVELDRNRRFAWRAPLSEWKRAYLGTILEIAPTSKGGSRAQETMYFDAREDHLPAVVGFLAMSGYDRGTMSAFLEARLKGLDRLIQNGGLKDGDLEYLFGQDRVMAADWPHRTSDGEWVRLLFADGEVDFPAPADEVFNVFSRFARYAD